jgi:GNAT superfamily N-acetyltransferase
VTTYTTRLLTPDTWDDFAALVEANNGVWGGCWCMGFHPLDELPRWRIGCIFTGSKHREKGVARAAVTAVLEEIRKRGGGVVEAYLEQVVDRKPQRGAYLHTGPESLYEDLGFVRDRQIAKWRWVMRLEVDS